MQQPDITLDEKVCEIEGCSKPHQARGMCKMHYTRWLRTGSTEKTNPEERFNSHWEIDVETGCWIWTAYLNRWGYGRLNVTRENGKSEKVLAHRRSWEMHHGPIPEGMLVCHRCDVPACVNPEHLFLGTTKDNAVDMARKDRQNGPRGESHHSAKMTAENVREIRDKYGRLNQYELAAEYGISQSAIWAIVTRKTWRKQM